MNQHDESRLARLLALFSICLAFGLLVGPALGQGGGITLYENGSPDMGSAYAGAGARAQDAATAFQNPAGMTRLDENHLLVGFFVAMSRVKLDLGAGTISDPPGSFDGGGANNTIQPGFGSFLVMPINDEWRFGFSVNALFAGGVDYHPTWVGRAYVTENDLIGMNFMPSVAYKVNDWWSVGGGLNLVYVQLNQELLADNTPGAATINIDEADDFAFAATLSTLIEFNEQTRMGVVYRSEISTELEGTIRTSAPVTVNFDSDVDFAQGINVSLYHDLNDRLALLADAGWSDWSTLDQQPITVGGAAVAIDRDWNDTWRLGVGLQYKLTDDWLLRTGFGYDSSPVDDDDNLPDLPTGAQYRFGIGLQHDFGQGKIFGINYTAMFVDSEIDNVTLPDGTVTLNGDYDDYMIHFIGVNLSLTF
ncbi:MAG: OmpP1/FadL family transporter [Planctomycetota bacterium]|jgi:long-chain fatty acid transport protein